MDGFHTVFGATRDVTLLQECARAALIFIFGLLLVRLLGRRVFGKWTALDIVVSIIVGSSLSRALTGSAPLEGTLAATTLLMSLHWLLARAASSSRIASHLVEGRSIHLGQGGDIDPSKRRRWAISEADLNEALRQAGMDDVSQARLLVLEPSGKISVLKN